MKQIIIHSFDSTEVIDVSTKFIARKRDGEFFVDGSDSWTCEGAVVLNNFGSIVERLSVAQLFSRLNTSKESLFYKNGKAKFRIIDKDHGTYRMQCNPVIQKNRIHTMRVIKGASK
jgi:hypothetical protein